MASSAFAKATTSFLKELKALEDSISQMERHRKRAVEELRYAVEADDNPDGVMFHELREMVAQRQEIGDLLARLDAAMDNSQSTFDRLEAKAAKDAKLLVEIEALQKRRGRGPVFDDKHPVVRTHRNAVEDLIQKLEFLDAAVTKFADMLNIKTGYRDHSIEELAELDAEVRRMRRDYGRYSGGPKSKIGEMTLTMQYYRRLLQPDPP